MFGNSSHGPFKITTEKTSGYLITRSGVGIFGALPPHIIHISHPSSITSTRLLRFDCGCEGSSGDLLLYI